MARIDTSPKKLVLPKGFSLVELLIALAIAMIIAAAMASLFAQSVKSRDKTDTDGQRIEAGRYALDVLSDDLHHAGFYGDYLPKSSINAQIAWPKTDPNLTWTATLPCDTTVATMGWSNSGTINVPVHIMGYEAHASGTLPGALTGCLPNYVTNTDVLVIRRVSTMSYAPSAAPQGDVFLQASSCNQDANKFVFAAKADASGSAFNLRNVNCNKPSPPTSPLAKINRYIVRIYYVATCNVCAPASDFIPTLKVAELQYVGGSLRMAGDVENGAYVPRSLVPGIQDFHVEYGVDNTGDGNPDSFSLSDASGSLPVPPSPTPPEWQNVMSVKVYVVARDLKTTSDYTDGKTYVLGRTSVGPFNDHYRRTVFSSSVRLVNPSEAREQ